jgi:hypothetical protein
MANASKRRPWAVEIKVPSSEQWFAMDAYADDETAQANAELMRKRSPEAEFRVVRKFRATGEA